MKRPVYRLLRALYGRQDSGTCWVWHCDAQVLTAGFEPVLRDTWPACYYCKELRLFLVVYVDDFKLAGTTKHLEEGWTRLRKGLDLEPPTLYGTPAWAAYTKIHHW